MVCIFDLRIHTYIREIKVHSQLTYFDNRSPSLSLPTCNPSKFFQYHFVLVPYICTPHARINSAFCRSVGGTVFLQLFFIQCTGIRPIPISYLVWKISIHAMNRSFETRERIKLDKSSGRPSQDLILLGER
jgi:hypothetical protein